MTSVRRVLIRLSAAAPVQELFAQRPLDADETALLERIALARCAVAQAGRAGA